LVLMAMPLFLSAFAGPSRESVRFIAPGRLRVSRPQGSGELAFYADLDLGKPQPSVIRAIVVFHGLQRNAFGYFRYVDQARSKAHVTPQSTLLLAPQFLNDDDAIAYPLSAQVLRWRHNSWEAGDPAIGPAPISSYDAIDSVLALLANRDRLPNLKEIVLAGHSGGAQVVQRYAVVGRAIDPVEKAGITVRFVVANPSSYVYFDQFRPEPSVAERCKEFDAWKYGFNTPPPYVGAADPVALEAAYISRHVIYLLGSKDDDPEGPEIDKSCAGEAQGKTRLRRGLAYFHYLQSRHATELEQQLWVVPGASHDAEAMFTSKCGLDALFGLGSCPPPLGNPPVK
jgi:pimeloyl-ACP methyl ester carboxylesterase